MNFRYRLMQFMSGRYGQDRLGNVLLVAAVIISILNVRLRIYFLQFLVYGLVIYAVFRILSRNIEARRRENAWFKSKTDYFKKQIDFYKQKKADKCHVYKKCPACKAILRLPYRIGTHKTVCPRCAREFVVKVRK